MSILYPTSKDMQLSSKRTWTFSDNVLPSASIFEMAVRNGGSVVSTPIEEGSFTTYNKTTEPLEITATLAFSGTDTYLQSVITNLGNLKESVKTFSVQTPYHEYQSMTLQSFDYAFKREDGLGALYVHAVFVEIREVQVAYTEQQTVAVSIPATETKDASAADNVDGGTEQAADASEDSASAYNGGSSESDVGESTAQGSTFLYDISGAWHL